jgi:hypothetical protein
VPFGFSYGYAPYYDYDYGYDCTRLERVPTPYGFRWRRVYVC